MTLERIDHLVLTVRDLQASIRFYTQVLGMTVALTFWSKSMTTELGAA
ncbi:MAG: hypothetical protein JWR15_1486 [Prosthecobacter sp.]|nr:hypothetical protein [Prosthecobacter sp.]